MKTASRAVSDFGSETRELPIETIDWSLAVRNIQRGHIGRLAGAASLPSVVVWEYEKGRFRGVDGYHRWYLAKLRRQETIHAIVRHYGSGPSGEKQFDFDCIRLNIQHGLPLTREERDRAIVRLWARWGRTSSRPHGVSLEELGRTFNLTRQRIQQIVLSTPSESIAADGRADLVKDASGKDTHRGLTRSSGYSSLGRFTAAAKRLSTVLGDTTFVQGLIHEHQEEVRERLQELRELLTSLLLAAGEPPNSSAFPHQERAASSGGNSPAPSRPF